MTITEKGKHYIHLFNTEKKKYFRISVVGGGCQGLQYSLAFTDETNKNDISFKADEIDVVMDFKSSLFLEGLTLDYSDGLNGKGWVFDNPTATKSCGCGTSFAV